MSFARRNDYVLGTVALHSSIRYSSALISAKVAAP